MIPNLRRTFVTRELTPGEGLAQAGWAKSDSGLLERLEVNGAHITVRRRNGAVDELTQGKFRCTSYRTGSGRRLFVIRTDDGRKIRFLEMDGMLSAEEWDIIADDVLGAVRSNLAAVVSRAGFSLVLGMLLGAVTTGILGGMFNLQDSQLAIGSPLGMGTIAAWTVAVWFGWGWSRRFF